MSYRQCAPQACGKWTGPGPARLVFAPNAGKNLHQKKAKTVWTQNVPFVESP